MSWHKKKKCWTASQLKRRGWTQELIRELLPKPRFAPGDGYYYRVWYRDDVLLAEDSPSFAEGRAETGTGQTVSLSNARRAGDALAQAWDGAEQDDSIPWLLAGHYHSAIRARLNSMRRGRGVHTSQATAWLSEFLALEQRCDSKRLPLWHNKDKSENPLFARVTPHRNTKWT